MTHMVSLPAQRKIYIPLVQCGKRRLVAVPQEDRNTHMGAPVLIVPEPPFSHRDAVFLESSNSYTFS